MECCDTCVEVYCIVQPHEKKYEERWGTPYESESDVKFRSCKEPSSILITCTVFNTNAFNK